MRSVVVVGAGPTGIAVATLLARHGIASTVLDRFIAPYPRPRAVHLDGEAVRILQRLGVHEAFAGISRPATGLRLLDASLRPFATFRRDRAPGRHGHPESNLFDQPELEALLRANLDTLPLATLRGGVTVTAVGPADAGRGDVLVTLHDVATGEREHLVTGAVLGCDGAGSTVRAAIGAELRGMRFAQRWLVVDVRCRRALTGWGGVDQICDPRRAATFMHLTGDRYRWEFRMRDGETEDELTRPARLAELTAPWLGAVPAGDWELLRSAEYSFRAGTADRWRRGRVLLLGDAAHLMPPFIGQGMGAGLRDAHNLAWKLAAVLHGEAGEDLLDTYQAERAPHVAAVTRTSVRVGRAMTGGKDIVAALRRPVVTALIRLPGAEARALSAITTRYGPSPWVDRGRRRRDLPGTLCPQPFVRFGGRRVRLDDILGDGFALLCAGPVDAEIRRRAEALGARSLRLATGRPGAVECPAEITDDGTLHAWLRAGRATAVLLRPDRVVLAADPAGERASGPPGT